MVEEPERKTEINIDLLFFTYRCYYDKDDVYHKDFVVEWLWCWVAGVLIISLITAV